MQMLLFRSPSEKKKQKHKPNQQNKFLKKTQITKLQPSNKKEKNNS